MRNNFYIIGLLSVLVTFLFSPPPHAGTLPE